MSKWIAFNDNDVAALASHTRAEVQLGIGDPLAVAAAAEAPALVMLPATGGRITVVTLTPASKPARAPERYVAAGFLGLTDELAGVDEPQEEQPSWWRRWFRP